MTNYPTEQLKCWKKGQGAARAVLHQLRQGQGEGRPALVRFRLGARRDSGRPRR